MRRLALITTLTLLLPSLVSAAIALDTTSSNTAGASPRTVSHTATGSNLVGIACVYMTATTDVSTGCTWGGVSMTKVTGVNNVATGDAYSVAAYKIIGPATGAQTVSCSASSGSLGLQTHTYTGAGDVEASNSATDQASPMTQSVTTITDNDWTVFCTSSRGSTPAASTGSTLRVNGVPGGAASFDSNGPLTPPGSKSMAVTSSNTMDGIILAVSPAGAAAATPFYGLAPWFYFFH